VLDKPPGIDGADAVAVAVATDGDVPPVLGLDRAALARAGFTGEVGQALALARPEGPALVAVGVGDPQRLDPAAVRHAAAAFARAVPQDSRLAVELVPLPAHGIAQMAAAVVEGVLLARYRFDRRSRHSGPVALTSLQLVASAGGRDEAQAGMRRASVTSRAAMLSRDLANCPAGELTASRLAEIAVEVGARTGLQVETFDRDALVALGCGGLLGVNKGSVNPPRMIRLRYVPEGDPTGRLTLVGKGIMYDSGGISLKPADASHSQMKNDMSGAGAVLAAMSALRDLGCRTAVTGYLMCTDNMPSGSAMQLGDVLVMRGGKTVEVLNTDAEGRLVMADALVLATEEPVDAIVDIATLTGACLRTFGTDIAGVMGNNEPLIGQIKAAGATADEPVWQLPLHQPYRTQLDSEIADLTNMGGPNAGSITAALFLQEFVDSVVWAHIDIAGTAQSETARSWVNKGPTGFGARLLIELALSFAPSRTSAGAGRAVR
jgi:leucyl aminopeptidase